MNYTVFHSENYYPIQSGSGILVFYRNLCFSWEDGFAPQLLYTDFGPPDVSALPDLPAAFFATLSAVAAENQGDPISAMLSVCAARTFPPDDAAAATHWAQSVNMMIRSLTHGAAAYSEAGFTLTGADEENTPVNLTKILETHCLPSAQTCQEEDAAMGTSENNSDVLSMEELLKIAEEAASADAPMDDPVLAEAAAEMPADNPIIPDIPIAEAEMPADGEIPVETAEEPAAEEEPVIEEPAADAADPNMAMTDDAVDAIVANMLGDIPSEPEMPDIDETAPLPEDIIPNIPLAEETPVEEAVPVEEMPVEEVPVDEAAPVDEEIASVEENDIPEDFPMEEPAAAADELLAEEAPAIEIPEAEAPVMESPAVEMPVPETSSCDGAQLLTPMNDDPAHCVLCVRVDPAEVGLDIPEGSTMMISDNTVIFPENGALLTQDLLTGAKDRSELNDSVLAAFSISMEHFATQNESYTLHSLLFSWLLKKLLSVSEEPVAAQKINDTLSFLGCPFQYTAEGFTDGAGQTLTAAEVFLKLSTQRI